MDHWEILVDYCGEYGLKMLQEQKRMVHYGSQTKERDSIHDIRMGLTPDKWQQGDILPAYLIVADNYDLYHKIVEYYKQDYICFGFQHDFYKFRDKVLAKYSKQEQDKKDNNKLRRRLIKQRLMREITDFFTNDNDMYFIDTDNDNDNDVDIAIDHDDKLKFNQHDFDT